MKNIGLIIILIIVVFYSFQIIETNQVIDSSDKVKQFGIHSGKHQHHQKIKSKTQKPKDNNKHIYQIFSKINRLSGMRKSNKKI